MSDAVVIGVGNRFRRDDGAGLVVVDRLRADLPEGVRVFGLEHIPPDLWEHWEAAERVFLIDAAASGAAPGTVRRFDPRSEPLPAQALRLSTHGFDLGQAIELARALCQLPGELSVFAIEGEVFSSGEGLSPAVARAVVEVARQIQDELEAAGA